MDSPVVRWAARIAVALAGLALLGWVSNLPQGEPAEHAVLRLAWRSITEKVSLCRQRTAEELAAMPAHMRQERMCRTRYLPYRLRVAVDGVPRLERIAAAAGARRDRPLYVQEDLTLSPGPHRLAIDFKAAPELATAEYGIDARSEEERSSLAQALARAAAFELARSLQVRAGRVLLVELDEQRQRFRVSGE